MRKVVLGVLLGLILAGPVWAAEEFKPVHVFQDAVAATGNGTALGVAGWSTIGVQVVISDTATVTFEATTDDSNWLSAVCTSVGSTSGALVSTATSSGLYKCNIAGMSQFRVRVSAYTGGTITVKGLLTLAKIFGGGVGGGGSGIATSVDNSTTLPATCTAGDVYVDTNATSGLRFYYCDSADTWVALLSSETQTLDQAFDQGKTIDGANSIANAFRVGDGATPMCHYTDATLGPLVRPCTAADVRQLILTNFTGGFYDEENDCWILRIDPDAASENAAWTFTCTATKPKKSVWFGAGSMSTDGTQCAAPAEVTINSGPKVWSVICTENDAGSMYFSVKMPDSYDGGTVTLTSSIVQTAADTGSMLLDAAAQCRGNGEAPSSTWGSEVAIDDAGVTGSNQNDFITSGAITPAGTCAAGDMMYFRVQIDATGNPTTAAATLNFLGFLMEYSVSSLSD
jgi:hypothetical protein